MNDDRYRQTLMTTASSQRKQTNNTITKLSRAYSDFATRRKQSVQKNKWFVAFAHSQ